MVEGNVRAFVVSRVVRWRGGLRAAGLFLLLTLVACQPSSGKKANAPTKSPTLHKADVAALGDGIAQQAPAQGGPGPEQPIYSGSARKWLESAGLYDLSKVTLPKGVVEVRLWDNIGVINGTIVQKRGSKFHGAQVFLPEDCRPGACAGWVVALQPCVPWQKLWSSLVDQGILEPPHGSGPTPPNAEETYTVEVQSDGKYWAKQYVPAADNGPAAQKVKALDAVTNRSLYCH